MTSRKAIVLSHCSLPGGIPNVRIRTTDRKRSVDGDIVSAIQTTFTSFRRAVIITEMSRVSAISAGGMNGWVRIYNRIKVNGLRSVH